MSGRLSSRNSLKSKHLEDIIQLPKYCKQTWYWVFDTLVLRWIKEILNDKKISTGLGCRNTGPRSLSPIFNTISDHGADIQLRASIKGSIKATADLPFPQQIHNLCNRRPKAIKPTSHRKRTGEKHHWLLKSLSLGRYFCREKAQLFLTS